MVANMGRRESSSEVRVQSFQVPGSRFQVPGSSALMSIADRLDGDAKQHTPGMRSGTFRSRKHGIRERGKWSFDLGHLAFERGTLKL